MNLAYNKRMDNRCNIEGDFFNSKEKFLNKKSTYLIFFHNSMYMYDTISTQECILHQLN